MAEVFIALGSNLGDRADNLHRAEDALSAVVTIQDRSSVHETAPQYVTDQPAFLNMVIAGETALTAKKLLLQLKAMEVLLGRVPSERFGPRVIDLDILYYGDSIVDSPDLVIPHPRLAERLFVLEPLAEIAPAKRHSVTGKSTVAMISALKGKS